MNHGCHSLHAAKRLAPILAASLLAGCAGPKEPARNPYAQPPMPKSSTLHRVEQMPYRCDGRQEVTLRLRVRADGQTVADALSFRGRQVPLDQNVGITGLLNPLLGTRITSAQGDWLWTEKGHVGTLTETASGRVLAANCRRDD